MTATDQQIKIAYEQGGKSPEFISEDFGFELYAVKAKLMQVSPKYRRDCGLEPVDQDELNLSREEQIQIKRALLNMALDEDTEPNIRAKLLLNLRDDGKGRKDVVQQVANSQFNILTLVNTSLQEARDSANNFKRSLIGQIET
jgi:hypothetical protein